MHDITQQNQAAQNEICDPIKEKKKRNLNPNTFHQLFVIV